jgi:uncharacterized protein (TIRG00374 family)
MVRNFEELGGIAVYTRELLEHLLAVDRTNEYVIFYGSVESIGTYAHFPNVREIHVPCRSKFLWDQAQVATEAERLGIDVMFSPKMSSPLLFRGRKVFAIHGAEQFVYAKEYPLLDRLYVRLFLPWFAKTSSRVIAVSHSAKRDLAAPLGVPPDRIAVTYHGPKEVFLRPIPEAERKRVVAKYGLEQGFLLHVGLVWGAKNFKVFPEVMEILGRRRTTVLAHAGKMRGWVRTESSSHGKIRELGFVPDEDLAALYQSADALVFPSLYEGFGIPLLEAMASGCPVITTNWGAMKEVCGDAALLVDSRNPAEIAAAVERLLDSPELRADLVRRGRERAREFSWDKTARDTLAILEGVHREGDVSAAKRIGADANGGSPEGADAGADLAVPNPPRRTWPSMLLKLAVSATLLGILVSHVDLRAVGSAIAGARIDLLVLAVLVLHADRILQGGKWWALIRSAGVRVPFWPAVATTYAGNFAGQFLPAGVGGDVVRIVLFKRMSLPAIEVTASIVVERLFGLFALVTVASASVALARTRGVDLPGSIEGVTAALFVSMAIGLAVSFTPKAAGWMSAGTAGLSRLPIPAPFLHVVDRLIAAYRRYAHRRNAIAVYTLLSVAEVLLLVLVNYLICGALGIGIPLLPLLLIVPVTLIAYRIPISLSGLGVQEGMFGYFFARAGYGIEAGVTLSLVLRLVEVAIFLPGAIFLWRGRKRASEVETAPPA